MCVKNNKNTRGKYSILFGDLRTYSKHDFQRHKSHRKDCYIYFNLKLETSIWQKIINNILKLEN